MIDLKSVFGSAIALEPLSETVTRLASIVTNADVDLREVVDVVCFDQALTTRLLRTANSAMYGGRSEISTVKEAVVRLGSGVVLTFAIATCVKDRMSGAVPEYGMGEKELWTHSVASALSAEVLRGLSRNPNVPPEAFTSALLHDVGKLVLGRYLKDDAARLLTEALEAGQCTLAFAEAEVLGVQHAELGALICKHWKMPDSIIHGIKFHHSPLEGREHVFEYEQGGARSVEAMDTLPAVVCLADQVAVAIGAGHGLDGEGPEATEESLKILRLTEQELERATEIASSKLDKLLASYG